MLASYMLLGENLVRIDFLLVLTLALSLLMVSSVAYPKIRNLKLLAFIASMFFAMVLLFFIDLSYMRFFSPIPFILMLVYMLSPFLKIPMLSNANHNKKRS